MEWKKIIFGKFSWGRVIRLPLIIYGVLLLIGGVFPYRLIFPYRGCSYETSLRGLEIIKTESGEDLATVYHKAPAEKYLALYFHGNAEDAGHIFGNTYDILRKGISILALDYPGYGLSEGKPTEASCQTAAETLYAKALSMGYKPEQLLLWGRSVGGGVALGLAETVHCKAVILESPFATAFTVKTQIPIVPFDKFHNLSKVKDLRSPLFIIHGEKDRLIPPKHSEKLFNAHQGRKERHLIPEAGHNDLWNYNTNAVMEKLLTFLNQE